MSTVLHPDTAFDQITVPHPQGGEVILVRYGDGVHAYRNSCPHLGVGLDYGDGRCLADADTLVCALHGARFEVATGYCFEGPCAGDSLQRVPISLVDDRIELADA